MTAAVRTRTFELTTTVTFHDVDLSAIESYARKLASAVGSVLPDYPAVEAFLAEPDMSTGDITFGLRFKAADPAYVEDMASEILERSVELVAEREGVEPVDAEREGSVLVLTQ